MYWIKLDLILLDSQFNRNSLAFHTVILGILGSQMQLRLSDIYMSVFHGEFFFFSQDYRIWPGLHLSKTFYHFSTNQISQCKQLYIHLLLHMKCVAVCHNLFLSSLFGFLSVLLSIVDMVATQKMCQGHLELRKQTLHSIHY